MLRFTTRVLFNKVSFFFVTVLYLLLSCSSPVKDDSEKSFSVKSDILNEVSNYNSQIKSSYKKDTILEKVVIELPKGLQKMTKEILSKNYAENVRPAVAYSNEDISATFSFSTVPQRIDESKLVELLPIMEQQFETLYPQINWISKRMTKVSRKPFIKYEFISPTTKKEVYSLVYFTEINGVLFISTFNCTIEQKNKWQSLARESMNSIREIKK